MQASLGWNIHFQVYKYVPVYSTGNSHRNWYRNRPARNRNSTLTFKTQARVLRGMYHECSQQVAVTLCITDKAYTNTM